MKLKLLVASNIDQPLSPMYYSITYPIQVAWRVDLSNIQNPIDAFPASVSKKVAKALTLLTSAAIEYRIDKVDESYLQQFYPLYEQNILSKKHPIKFDIYQRILYPKHNFPYLAVSLYVDGKYSGGLIFSHKDAYLATAYKVFPRSPADFKLPVNFSLIAEYFLYKYALENKITQLKRGKDPNQFGVGCDIGLAVYKLQAGFIPYVSE